MKQKQMKKDTITFTIATIATKKISSKGILQFPFLTSSSLETTVVVVLNEV